MHQVDFSYTQLKQSIFEECDLLNSVFEHSQLEKVDFSTSHQVQIEIESCSLKGSKFSQHQLLGLLQKSGIILVD